MKKATRRKTKKQARKATGWENPENILLMDEQTDNPPTNKEGLLQDVRSNRKDEEGLLMLQRCLILTRHPPWKPITAFKKPPACRRMPSKATRKRGSRKGWITTTSLIALASLFLWTRHRALRSLVTEMKQKQEEIDFQVKRRVKRRKDDEEPFYFGACMIFKDDNKMLPEWLAYHYQVLPLRRLVIGVDPFNLTGVDHIVDKYRSIGLNITVLLEKDYIMSFRGKRQPDPNDKYQFHLWRQNALFTKCSKILRRENISWTAFLDTDEYITFNRYHPHHELAFEDCRINDKDFSPTCMHEMKRSLTVNLTHPRAKLPFVGEVSIARYMHENNATLWEDYLQFGCMVLPRVHFGFGGEEFNHGLAVSSRLGVPPGFDPQEFITLLSRYHHPMIPFSAGKSVTNLRACGPFIIHDLHVVCPFGKSPATNERKYWHVHSRDDSEKGFPFLSRAIFRINHYLGRMETHQRIGSIHTNRGIEQYREKARERTIGPNQDVQGWLQAFINNVGHDVAYDLTVGLRQWAYETDEKAFAVARLATASTNNESIRRR